MKIILIDTKRCVSYLLIAVLAVSIFSILLAFNKEVISAFSQERALPIYSVECDQKKVAITFDCAWGADDIPSILKALKNENIKASFFIVGQWAEKYPEAVKMIANDGHDIANHSYSHTRMGNMDKRSVEKEITLCSSKLKEIAGCKVELFRPPYGDYSNNVVNTAKNLGYYTIQWDVDSLDWKPGISKQNIYERVITKVNPGSIILFHNDTAHTASVLPEIISALKKEGYSFVPVSELIMRENYIIDFKGQQKKKE